MSSNYVVLCLSHDPAIRATGLEGSSYGVAAEIRAELLAGDHAGCDLVVGRYSYPLIEVRCYFTEGVCNLHSVPVDWRAEHLVLLAEASRYGGFLSEVATKAGGSCWRSKKRLSALRKELAWVTEQVNR